MALPVSLSGLSTAVACCGPFKSDAYEAGSSSVSQLGGTSSFTVGQGVANARRAQSFKLPISAGVTQVTLKLQKFGSPVDNIVLEIRSGSQAGPVLGSKAIAATAISTSTSDVDFVFTSPVDLQFDTTYWLVISRSGAIHASNFCAVVRQTSGNPYADGVDSVYNSDTDTWTENSTVDLYFIINYDFPAKVDEYYFFGRDGTTASALDAYKSTDPANSWAEQTTVSATSTIVMLAGYRVGNVIHLVISGGTGDYRYVTYNTAADSFGTVETIQTGLSIAGQVSAAPAASIVVRSDGVVVVLYQGATASVMGTARARIRYARRATNGTWTTAVVVDAEGAFDWVNPEALLGSSDRTHFFWYFDGAGTVEHRALNSSNSLQTASTAAGGLSSARFMQGVSYDASGTQKIAVLGSDGTNCGCVYFDSADTVTLNVGTEYAGTEPARLFNDGVDVWALYRKAADSDLYVRKSTDHGATFGAETNAFTATVAAANVNLSIDGNIYSRG